MNAAENNILYDALKLETDANSIVGDLIAAIALSKISPSCYAFKSRVKPEGKLYEKLKRKQKTKSGYVLTDIKDVIGLRLVTLFRKEMPDVVSSVISLINHEINLHPNPFLKNSIEELIIYSANPAHDAIAHQISSTLTESNTEFILDGTHASYSSVHIVARVNKQSNMKHHCNIHIPVEIQIRTVFEDAWGEVDHKFGYVIRTGKEAGKPVGNASMVQEHLKVLKKFSDACAEYADVIFTEAVPQDRKSVIEGKVISVGSDKEILERFDVLAVPKEYINAYGEGRRQREDASMLMESEPQKGKEGLIKAADFFKTLGDAISTENELLSEAVKLFLYYTRMNEGLCLLSTSERSGIELAAKIYANLEDEYGDYPLVTFRYAQALGKLGNSDMAIAKFREAKEKLFQIDKLFGTNVTDKLPHDDREHIEHLLPKLLGFQLWINSEKVTDDNSKRANLLVQAFDETKHLLEKLPLDGTVHNNLLYYAVDYLELESPPPPQFVKQMEESLKFLEKINIPTQSNDLEKLDTCLRAYIFLKRKSDALAVAKRILDIWKKGLAEISLLDVSVVMDIVRLAFKTCTTEQSNSIN